MEIYNIIDEIELLLKEGKKVPFSSGKVLVESHILLDRLDRIRAILPEELYKAKELLEDKDRIVKEACDEAEQYVEESKDRAARLVDNNEITKNAMNMSEDIINKAEETAYQIRKDANEYADGVLCHIEVVLKKGLEAIEQGHEEINRAINDREV